MYATASVLMVQWYAPFSLQLALGCTNLRWPVAELRNDRKSEGVNERARTGGDEAGRL